MKVGSPRKLFRKKLHIWLCELSDNPSLPGYANLYHNSLAEIIQDRAEDGTPGVSGGRPQLCH